mmetsp:Transcript_90253/g.141463  ORF Transcript_90253/g.141463 Transcript_90253/m.141463 type:complete len:128 (-) Transcript_90253:103-486(-)
MARIMQIVLAAAACQCVVGFNLRVGSNSTFTVNDIIKINDVEVAKGTGIDQVLGCNIAPKDATKVTVCGCNVKVEASLLTECQPYGKYSHSVGACDCGQSGCVTSELKSGYTEEFSWVAASYKVEKC